jgi:hypothetical protein
MRRAHARLVVGLTTLLVVAGYAMSGTMGSAMGATSSPAWRTDGNAVKPGAFLGTTNAQALVLKVAGQRVVRYEPTSGTPNVVGGSRANAAASGTEGVTISGGGPNAANGDFSTVGGGDGNVAGGDESSVLGGSGNTASGGDSTIGGGTLNTASNVYATVAGGAGNTAGEFGAAVGGGVENTAGATSATVGGGDGNTASGFSSTVPGGTSNRATGRGSFAAGDRAVADDDGSFAWADTSGPEFHTDTFPCVGQAGCVPTSGENTFNVRATGGVRFVTAIDGSGDATNGCYLDAGGSGWNCVSDRNAKRDFQRVDDLAVLRALAGMDVSTWRYRDEAGSVRHLGPTAQAFYRAFHLGNDRGTINSVDAQGVAFAAIRGLLRQVRDLKAQLADQRRVDQRQDRAIHRLERIMSRLATANPGP